MTVETRQAYIMERLRIAKEPVSGNALAEELNVSSRTIRNLIKQLNASLKAYGAAIESRRGSGYQLIIYDSRAFAKWADGTKRQKEAQGDRDGRKRWIIEFLVDHTYLKLDRAADQLYVSRSTLSQDLKALKPILGKYGLSLKSKPNYGIYIDGEEYDFRLFLLNEGPKKEADPALVRLIHEWAGQTGVVLRGDGIAEIARYIQIARRRNAAGHPLKTLPFDPGCLRNEAEFEWSGRMLKSLSEEAPPLTAGDRLFLTMLIIKHRVTSMVYPNDLADAGGLADLTEAVTDLLEQRLALRPTKEWRQYFIRHLLPALKRARYGLVAKNEMLEEIKKQYPHAFDLALQAIDLIKDRFGITLSEDEAGFLALHLQQAREARLEKIPVAIVCTSGIASAQILKKKVEGLYGNRLQITGLYDSGALKDKIGRHCRLILSTVPLPDDVGCPVLVVHPLLTADDQIKIQTAIKSSDRSPLKPPLFFRDVTFRSPTDAIVFLAGAVIRNGYAPEELLALTLKRERVSPTAFGGNMALPHPAEPCGYETVLAVALLNKPMDWGPDRQKVELVFLLSVKKGNDRDLDDIYERLLLIMERPALQKKALQLDGFSAFQRFWEQLDAVR